MLWAHKLLGSCSCDCFVKFGYWLGVKRDGDQTIGATVDTPILGWHREGVYY